MQYESFKNILLVIPKELRNNTNELEVILVFFIVQRNIMRDIFQSGVLEACEKWMWLNYLSVPGVCWLCAMFDTKEQDSTSLFPQFYSVWLHS